MVSFVPVTIFVLNVIQPDVQLRDIMDLSCQKTSQNQVIERSSDFISGSSSLYIPILQSLGSIGIMVIDTSRS